MTLRRNPTQHERMVYTVATQLDEEGYSDIKADVEGYELPEKIWWESEEHDFFYPDLTASKNSTTYYFEVETGDTIFLPETARQWKLFSAHANHINGKYIIIVPTGYADEAQQQVENLGISVDDIWDVEA